MNKKMDLKNYNVVSLNEQEAKEIDGGLRPGPWGWVGIGYVLGEIANGIQEGMQGDCPCENN